MKLAAIAIPVSLFIAVTSAQGRSLAERAQPYLESARAAGSAFVNVSAASGMPNISADSLVTAFGSNLAPRTEVGVAPYPTALGGATIQVTDALGVTRTAQLLYVSPAQIDYLMPAGTASGTATIHIVGQNGTDLSSSAQIQTVAPGLFTANANGSGVIAATAYRLVDLRLPGPVTVFQCGADPGSCVSVPIDIGVDAPVFVTLYMTGLRGRTGDSDVSVTIGGQSVPIRSITPGDDSGALAGIDQVVVLLPLSLRGSGEVDVVVTVGATRSNTGRINIQ